MTDKPSVSERLGRLRERMEEENIYAYFIPSSDFHASEYTNDHFKVREFFSGFTGSAGELLVLPDKALLWTDGRYFLQAGRELEGSGIDLMRAGEDGVDTLEEYIKEQLPRDACLGFDGRTVSVRRAKKLKKAVPSRKIRYKKDLSEGIFHRPAFPRSEISVLDIGLSGESSIDRMEKLRAELKNKGCNAIFISKLEDTAYLFNIRGEDIEHTPVPLSYAYITLEKAYVFLKDEKADTGYEASIVRSYDEVYDFLKSGKVSGKVLIDENSVNYRCYKLLKKHSETVEGTSPVQMMRAVKNDVELSHIRDIYHKDSLQMTRFIKWLVTSGESKTEISAAGKLEAFRRIIPEYNGPSFTTIAAYADNAAVIHYEPSAEHDRPIEKRGMFMVDSGGQYKGGTTDVTRTVIMGELTDEEKEAFTMVACGMLRIRYSSFKKGTTGAGIDILAREKLWKKGMDYRHGTGHGVGYMLNVHEGPQAITSKAAENTAALKPGMLVSDEPGVYREGRFGVRTENILLVEKERITEDGEFYCFRNLTQVPIDDRGMAKELMSSEELDMYERFQREVADALAGDLDKEELDWLYDYCGLSPDPAAGA